MQAVQGLHLPRATPVRSLVQGGARLWLRALWLAVFLVLPFGCGPVRLVSPYDEQLDKGTSDVHTEIAQFVAKMAIAAGKPEGTYEANANFYAELSGKVSTLKLRAAAQGKNTISVKLFEELATSTGKLEELHKSGAAGGLSHALGDPALEGIDVICESILKFEIAKRRGDAD
jgi:hypothetical protein